MGIPSLTEAIQGQLVSTQHMTVVMRQLQVMLQGVHVLGRHTVKSNCKLKLQERFALEV